MHLQGKHEGRVEYGEYQNGTARAFSPAIGRCHPKRKANTLCTIPPMQKCSIRIISSKTDLMKKEVAITERPAPQTALTNSYRMVVNFVEDFHKVASFTRMSAYLV